MRTEDGNECKLTHTQQDITLAADTARQTYWINHKVDEEHPLTFESLSISAADGKTSTVAFSKKDGFASTEKRLFADNSTKLSLVRRVMNNLGISCTDASGDAVVPNFTLKDIEGLKKSKEDGALGK